MQASPMRQMSLLSCVYLPRSSFHDHGTSKVYVFAYPHVGRKIVGSAHRDNPQGSVRAGYPVDELVYGPITPACNNSLTPAGGKLAGHLSDVAWMLADYHVTCHARLVQLASHRRIQLARFAAACSGIHKKLYAGFFFQLTNFLIFSAVSLICLACFIPGTCPITLSVTLLLTDSVTFFWTDSTNLLSMDCSSSSDAASSPVHAFSADSFSADSLTPLISFLMPLISLTVLPMPSPIPGSRLAPKISRMISAMIRISGTPNPKM